MSDYFKLCSACKKEISYGMEYYVCSVSTCNKKRGGFVFCSMPCFDSHVGVLRHRDAGAFIERAPKTKEEAEKLDSCEAKKNVYHEKKESAMSSHTGEPLITEVLVVASKVKKYIKDSSGYNTSASTLEELTKRVVTLCDGAVKNAMKDGRRTVMDRDVPPIENEY